MEENSEVLHLKALLSYFERGNIEYCIVGNTRGAPDEIHGDVDIVVQPTQIAQLNVFFCDFAKIRRIRIIQIIQHEQVAWCYVFFWYDDNHKPKFLCVDICGDYFCNGQFLISADEILKDRIQNKGNIGIKTNYYTPNPKKAFIYYLIKKVLKQEITYKQTQYLLEKWDEDSVGCWEQIRRFWAEKETKEIIEAIETKNHNLLNDLIPGLKNSLRKNLNFSMPHFFREIKRIILRISAPTGMTVAFLGPDGSGKSSVIENIIHDLMPVFRNTGVYHFRPRIAQRNIKISELVKNPHSKAPRGQLGSVLKIFYYFFDYSIGYVVKIRPLIARSTLVLYDRYYHDLLVDPKRYRYGASTWLAQCIGKGIPVPDLWILLDAPPDVIQLRKKETSYSETNRQRKAYLELSKRLNNCYVVDSSAPQSSVVEDVKNAILTFLTKRIERSIGY